MSVQERERRFLLLSGPQYYAPERPFTSTLRRNLEEASPLGIAIVAGQLKKHGIKDIHWMEMHPHRIPQLKSAIETATDVLVSSRLFDTCLAQQAISSANRQRKPSIVGGYGPTLNPDLFPQATTIVRGEVEPVIDQLIDDLLSHRLQPQYDTTSSPRHDIYNHYRWPDRSIFPPPRGIERTWRKTTQEWQRGCTNRCTYCCPTVLQRNLRTRKVSDIIAEIEAMKLKRGDLLFSVDSNTAAIPRELLLELFAYLKRQGILWVTEGTVAPLIQDFEAHGKNSLFHLMSARDGGGCIYYLYGADDLELDHVAGSRDKHLSLLAKATGLFRQMGIPLCISVVVGLDHHRYPDTFFTIASTLQPLHAPASFIHIATPYRGTPWGNKKISQGKIFDTDPSHYNHRQVVFNPENMTPEQLYQGGLWLLRQLYSKSQIVTTAASNFDLASLTRNPKLAAVQMGLPGSLEIFLSNLELATRGYHDPKIQQELDSGFRNWLNRSS